MKVKVRGIYSTALTKLLLDNGFQIVQPSLAIKDRFKLPENSTQPDIKIKDRFDLQGIKVLGASEVVDAFQKILQLTFLDVITRKWAVGVNGIYKGNVVKSDEHTIYVDLGGGIVGRLPKSESANKKDNQLLVQVERERIRSRQPVLTTNLKVIGDHAILMQNCKVGVSLKIQDPNKRPELYALEKLLAPNGWGIIWRESSAEQSRGTLENEIAKLVEWTKMIAEKASNAEAPALLAEGSYFMDVEFPWFSRSHMDQLRASAAPTLGGHHFYKSCGGKVSAALEMAEKLLEKGQNACEVKKLFKGQILYEFPEYGSIVDVEHVKLSGLVFHLGEATMEGIDDKQITYSRIMRSNGMYDGLGSRKEAGDRAKSETKLGEWYIKTNYYSDSGEWKGTYINMNTSIEVYPKAIRYVDLEVDICLQRSGEIEILDMEKLENAVGKGFINQKLFEMVKQKVNEIMEMLKEKSPL